MKLKALILISLFSITSSALAQFFPAQAYVTVFPAQVTGQVFNPYMRPIICNGQVFGQTSFGLILNSFFVEQLLPPGTSRFVFVRTNPMQPFVHGWSNIHCRFF
jgi:4-hydroxybenzoate polyprenyltransferase